MANLIIFGNAKMAELAHFYFSHDTPHKVVAFTVNGKYIKEKHFKGLPVVPFEEVEKIYPPRSFRMFIAVGYKKLNKIRADKYYEAKEKGYQLVSYLSSKAIYWDDLTIGDNCFILENQVTQPYVTIGNNVIIWSGNNICHDVTIGDHCWISSHVVCLGGVNIGPYTFVGGNATVKDHVKIGSQCIIGMGAVINKNTKDNEVYVAKPARRHRLDSSVLSKLL